ncbi:HlyD family secretion protein [Vibrio mexicanus]|uniref:HlyD family secretion protein n=1 Tax=Vibrio mexicanus TaxID=1004326 RepID=UPI00063CE178|nr:HlyD family secretion protein [Vibrio mexicanus]
MKENQLFIRWMKILSIVFFVSFVYLIVADRRAPFTTEGRVYGQVVQIAPEVTSKVVSVNVANNEAVAEGDVLFVLDDRKYAIALEQAKLSLQSAKEKEHALRAQRYAAVANIDRAKASYENAHTEYLRIQELAKSQSVSKSTVDSLSKQYQVARAALEIENQNLEMLNAQIGTHADGTTEVRLAKSRLEQAKLDLNNTIVRAPSAGVVTNLKLEVGAMANSNMPLVTFVSEGSMWVAADFREKSVTRVDEEYLALVTFDAYPGQIFRYNVGSRDKGVATGHQNPNGTLTQIEVNNRWVRDAQRTRINLEHEEPLPSSLFVGSRATLSLYSGESRFWQFIARARVQLVSWFHFIY